MARTELGDGMIARIEEMKLSSAGLLLLLAAAAMTVFSDVGADRSKQASTVVLLGNSAH